MILLLHKADDTVRARCEDCAKLYVLEPRERAAAASRGGSHAFMLGPE